MKKLNLNEAPKTVAFTFGRFNPPTTGHEKLCDAVRKANPSDYKIFVSHKQDPKTDPLQYAKKIAYMKQSFSKHKKNIEESRIIASYIQSNILLLLHPFIPFFTEKVWLDFKREVLSSSNKLI